MIRYFLGAIAQDDLNEHPQIIFVRYFQGKVTQQFIYGRRNLFYWRAEG